MDHAFAIRAAGAKRTSTATVQVSQTAVISSQDAGDMVCGTADRDDRDDQAV